MTIFLNGKFLAQKDAKISVFDHGFLYGDGIYETLRTFQGKIWQIDEHLDRLQKSGKLIGLELPWSKIQMKKWVEKLLKLNNFSESRIRITVTRGMNNFDFGSCLNPTILMMVQELKSEPKSVYQKGVRAITFKMDRVLPEAKTINLLPFILAQQELKKMDAYEAFYLDSKNYLTEGSVSNFFLIKKGALMTSGKNILAGTMRKVILKLARRLKIPTRIQNISRLQFYKSDEIFMTNAVRGIVPVYQVDGKIIGEGVPGVLTKILMKGFEEYVREFRDEF